MSILIKGDTSLRYQLTDTDKYKFTETAWEVISCISVIGPNIIIQSDSDPNTEDLIIPYASVSSPVTANITELKEVLWCWYLSKSRSAKDENGDPYILHLPDLSATCFGIISHNACDNVLQAIGNTLYFDGLPVGGAGGGIITAESGLYNFNATTARLGGPFLEDIYHDASGFEYFISNFSTWRVQLGAGDPDASIICDSARTRISRGIGNLEIATPGVINSTVNVGDQLALIDVATGEVEYTQYAQNSGEVFELLATISYNVPDVSQVRYYGMNTNLASSQLNLPPNPREGRTITLYDRNGNSGAFPLILNGNGHLIVDIAAPAATKDITTAYGSITVMFAGSSTTWYVIART